MSLLLDALKKAADDKKNSAHDASPCNDALVLTDHAPVEDSSTRLEFELQLDTSSVESNEALDDSAPALTPNPDQTDTPVDSLAPSAEPEPDLYRPTCDAKAFTEPPVTHIENQKALIALINKSNQQRAREKRRSLIGISVLILLVISSSALYFLLDRTTRSQPLFLAQVPSKPVQAVEPVATSTPPVAKSHSTPAEPTSPTIADPIKPARKKSVTATRPRTVSATPAPAISIIQGHKADPLDDQLNEAYRAFHRDKLNHASRLYSDVLQQEPSNRDALLGLAAIAIKQQRPGDARAIYQQLLRLHPGDSVATAALSNIETSIDSQLNETQLKLMLRQQPSAAHLHFALGSRYANQQRWPEAQSAFFNAWSSDKSNADYSFNLAVSLDHLGKHQQALNFYQRSLQLQHHSSAGFSVEAIERRIHTLRSLLP